MWCFKNTVKPQFNLDTRNAWIVRGYVQGKMLRYMVEWIVFMGWFRVQNAFKNGYVKQGKWKIKGEKLNIVLKHESLVKLSSCSVNTWKLLTVKTNNPQTQDQDPRQSQDSKTIEISRWGMKMVNGLAGYGFEKSSFGCCASRLSKSQKTTTRGRVRVVRVRVRVEVKVMFRK